MPSVRASEALRALPDLRRHLLAAGNPLSATFWESTESLLGRIDAGAATVGDEQKWLEATGTEPSAMIGFLVWDEESERSPLQVEMHGGLVRFLEERLAAGEIDPDLLVTDDAARKAHLELWAPEGAGEEDWGDDPRKPSQDLGAQR